MPTTNDLPVCTVNVLVPVPIRTLVVDVADVPGEATALAALAAALAALAAAASALPAADSTVGICPLIHVATELVSDTKGMRAATNASALVMNTLGASLLDGAVGSAVITGGDVAIYVKPSISKLQSLTTW